jgi:ketosteroid isomerase-like protein
MSEENVEVVRSGITAFSRRDVEAFLELGHPDIQFRGSGRLPGVQPVKGLEAVRAWCEEIFGAFEVALVPSQFVEAGDVVVATVKVVARGRGSGLTLDRTLAFVWHFKDGLVTEFDAYADRSEALEEAGLSE